MHRISLIRKDLIIKPDITKIDFIKSNFTPKTKKQLQRLLGAINWFRPFIMHFSDKISTITDKLKGSKKFVWSREDTDIIESIIKDIEKQTLLYHPNYSMPFELRTDASNVAISAILTQDNKLAGIYSKKLSESELKYSTVEKEF